METGLHERDRAGVQDFVLLENFTSEAAFIDNLKKRFQENLIYVSKREERSTLSLSTHFNSISISISVTLPLLVYFKTSCWNCVSLRCPLLV